MKIDQLRKVLSKLKSGKSRDPHGLVNEIFKPRVIGTDLKLSMLTMFNELKLNKMIINLAKKILIK